MDPILHRFLHGATTSDDLLSESPTFIIRIFQALEDSEALKEVDPALLAGRVKAVFPSPLPAWLQPHAPTSEPLSQPQDLFIAVKNGDHALISTLAARFPDAIRQIKDEEGRSPLFYACLADQFDPPLFTMLAGICPEWLSQPDNQGRFPVEFLSEESDKACYAQLPMFSDQKVFIKHLTTLSSKNVSILQGFLKDRSDNPTSDYDAFSLYFEVAKDFIERSEKSHTLTLIKALVSVWPQFPGKLFAVALDCELLAYILAFNELSIKHIKAPAGFISSLGLDQWSLFREDLPEELLVLYVLNALNPDHPVTVDVMQNTPSELTHYLSKDAQPPKIHGDSSLGLIKLYSDYPHFLSLITPECLTEDIAYKMANKLTTKLLDGNFLISAFVSSFYAFPTATQIFLLNAFQDTAFKNQSPLEFLILYVQAQYNETSINAFLSTFKTLFKTVSPASLADFKQDLPRLLNALRTCMPKTGIEPITWLIKSGSLKDTFSEDEIADALYPPGSFQTLNSTQLHLQHLLNLIDAGAPLCLHNFLDLIRFKYKGQVLDKLACAWSKTCKDVIDSQSLCFSDTFSYTNTLNNLIETALISADTQSYHHRKVVHLIIELWEHIPPTTILRIPIDVIYTITFECGLNLEGAQLLNLGNLAINPDEEFFNRECFSMLQEMFSQDIAKACSELSQTYRDCGITFSEGAEGAFVIQIPEQPATRLFGNTSALKAVGYQKILGVWSQALQTSFPSKRLNKDTVVEAPLFIERNESLLIKTDPKNFSFIFYFLDAKSGSVQTEVLSILNVKTLNEIYLKINEIQRDLAIEVEMNPEPTQETMDSWPLTHYELRRLPWGGFKLFYKEPETETSFTGEFYGENPALEFLEKNKKRFELTQSIKSFCKPIPNLHFVPLFGYAENRLRATQASTAMKQYSVILLENTPFVLTDKGPFGPIGFTFSPTMGENEMTNLLELSNLALGTTVSGDIRAKLPAAASLSLPNEPADTDLNILLNSKKLSQDAVKTLTYFIQVIQLEVIVDEWGPDKQASDYLKFRNIATHLIKKLSEPENTHALHCFIEQAAVEGAFCGKGLWELVWMNYQIQFRGSLIEDLSGSLDAILARVFDQAVDDFKTRLLYLSHHPYVKNQSTHVSAYLNKFLYQKKSILSLDDADKNDPYADIYGSQVFSPGSLEFMWNAMMPMILVERFKETLISSSLEVKGTLQNALKFHLEEELKAESSSFWVNDHQQVRYHTTKYQAETGTRSIKQTENSSPNNARKRSAHSAALDERIPKGNRQQEVDLLIETIYEEQKLIEPIDPDAAYSVYLPTAKALLFLLERKGILTRA